MKMIGRIAAAQRLGMTPQALSCHVSRRNWDAVPVPIQVGGTFKWSDEKITEWINDKFEAIENQVSTKGSNKKRKPGRPRKIKGASCS